MSMLCIDSENDFRKCFDEYYIPLCIFAERFVGERAVASDIVQECFIALWHKRKGFDRLEAVRFCLYTAVRNRGLNELSRRKTAEHYRQTLKERFDEAFFRDQVIEQELYRMVNALISALPGNAAVS
ncbi:MAG: hypothetical protein LUD68_10805 [Rikenellaceae bacterium]|nr:hypothetical protein [Rikenellaceae bacterium]